MGRIRNLATNNFFLLLTFIGVCTLLIFAIIHFSNYKDVNNISIEYYHEKSELILTNKNISDPGDKKPKLHEEVLRKIEEFPKEELEIVVRVDGDEQINKVSKMIESLGGSVSDNFKIGDIVVAKLEANKIDELAKEREILEISPEIEYTIFLNESISAFEIDRIAWGNGISGKNVKIAIVDTGINSNHEMLSGKVMAAKSFVDSEDENDLNGHGTHCAGIAAGDGVLRGVAPKASLLNAKVLDKYGRGKSSQIIAGINWAVENGADIISMSFGSTTNDIDGSLASTIREAINRGVIFVAASGNCRTGCGGFYGVTMPGSMEEVITIGAINDNKNIAGFSSGQNFGSYIKPDFVEPGVGIISAYNDGNYKEMSGTSMSTPFAAGIIALVLDRYGKMNQTEIIKKLRDASDDLGDSGKDDKYGFGVINISKLFFASDGNNDDNEAGNNSNGWTNLSFSGLITKDIDDARFLYQKNFSVRVRNSIANSFVVYEFNSGIFSVEEIKFENAYFLADYLYSILPLSKRDELVIVNSKYSYIYFLDSYIWYNNYSVYIASFADFENISKYLDIYSMNTGNLVGRTFDENVENLKYFDDASIKYLSSLAKESLTNKNEEKNISAQWGGDTPSTAKKLNFDTSEYETFWTEGASNWYYTETTKRGTINFEITNIGSGDDLDLYVYDNLVSNLLCSSEKASNNNEKCTVTKNTNANWRFYIKVIPYKISGGYASGYIKTSATCSYAWLNRYCINNKLYDQYQNTDCSINDILYKNCDDYDDPGTWSSPICENGKLVKKKTIIDGSCTDCTSAASCTINQRTETQIVENCVYGCSSGSNKCYQCNSDSNCAYGQKCSNYRCVAKTCSDYPNNAGSCSLSQYLSGWSDCSNNNPTKCSQFENIYCMKYTDICTSDEYCDQNGIYDSICSPYPCTINSISWDKTSAVAGEKVGITVSGSHCNSSNYVTFKVYENDCWGIMNSSISDNGGGQIKNETINYTTQLCNREVTNHPQTAYFSNNIAKSFWNAEFQSDLNGDPEYYVHGFKNGDYNEKVVSSNYLTVSARCADYPNTAGICYKENALKKEGNTIYRCEDQILIGELLCWEKVSKLGDDNFCALGIACDRNEYDCDYNSECVSGLQCKGAAICLGFECGCCNSNEDWSTSSKSCKRQNGYACGVDSECMSRHCVHYICRPTNPYPGDGFCDAGENCSNSPIDCKKCDGDSCTSASECMGKYCVHKKCSSKPYIVGDGYCDFRDGESPSNSPNDCYGQLAVVEIVSVPKIVEQNASVVIKAKVKNLGTYKDTLRLEAAIVPDYWEGTIFSEGFDVQVYSSITKCCSANYYYDAKNITLDGGESEEVIFNLIAPNIHSIDACSSKPSFLSAWDDSHTVVVGLYKACGQGYTNKATKDIKIKDRTCIKDSDCWTGEVCNFSKGIPGICTIPKCINACSSFGYYCVGNEIKQCVDNNKDGCFEINHIAACTGKYVCKDGLSSCYYSPISTKLNIDYVNEGTNIIKQPGDLIKLRLKFVKPEIITLNYDSNVFSIFNCSKSFKITADKECILFVNNNVSVGEYTIGLLNGSNKIIRIIKEPRFIIITDRNKLMQRYADEDEVNKLLAEAYTRAWNENGIVYDVGDYISNEIWNSILEYPGGKYAVK